MSAPPVRMVIPKTDFRRVSPDLAAPKSIQKKNKYCRSGEKRCGENPTSEDPRVAQSREAGDGEQPETIRKVRVYRMSPENNRRASRCTSQGTWAEYGRPVVGWFSALEQLKCAATDA